MNFFSPAGQDRFLFDHFFRGKRGGVFVDAGARDGEQGSNTLFFEQRLDMRADVRLCRYEDLVRDPAQVLREIYEFADARCPGELRVDDVSSDSIALGRKLPFSREVAERCDQLLGRLEDVHSRKSRCA